MLFDSASVLLAAASTSAPATSVLLAGAASTAVKLAAPGSVVAPGWLLPTASLATAAIPAVLLPVLKGMEQDKKEWETSAPDPADSVCAAHSDAFAVAEAGAKGLGLFAMQRVPKGSYLFDYTGELLSQTEYDVRYPNSVSDYTAGLRLPSGQMHFIDGRDEVLGAPGRFMNHDGGRPNVGRRTFCEAGAPPRILMYAIRDIDVGDELQWNYGDGYWAARDGLVED